MRPAERLAGLLALVLGLLHWWLAPDSGTDLAAQLARASFARAAPFTPVDLSWYGGIHPFGYSLLSPWLMALLGVQLSGLIAAVLGAYLLARLFRTARRPFLASVAGAVFVAADVASGRVTFALGAVAGLAALNALPNRRWAAFFGVLTGLFSPVAAVFLGMAAAVLVLCRRPAGWSMGLATTIPVVTIAVLFPGGGVQPFAPHSARPAVLSALAIAVLTSVRVVRISALVYAGAIGLFLVHEDPFGSNVLRLGLLVAAPVLIATARKMSLTMLVATALIVSWQIGPTTSDLEAAKGPPLGGLRAELLHLNAVRAEVIAPRDHREAWYIAKRVPLARGWSRQLDFKLNPLFYKAYLTAPDYLDWLHDNAVDYVALPLQAKLDFGAETEGALVATGDVPGLEPVWQDDNWVIFQVAGANPIATPAHVVTSTRVSLRLEVQPGDVDVQIRWSHWLTVSGPACIHKYGDHVRLRVSRPGTVVISSSLWPGGHC